MADGAPMAAAERWYCAAELAGLPSLPATHSAVLRQAKRCGWQSRARAGRGGGQEYSFSSLPPVTQAALLLREQPAIERKPKPALSDERIASIWQRFERVKQPLKDTAGRRLKALHAVESLVHGGTSLMQAREIVAAQLQRENMPAASAVSIARWQDLVRDAHRSDWLALLVPQYTGRTATASIPPAAWELFKADWLRVEAPSAESCYARLQRIATANPDWPALPSLRTFMRRIERELPRGVRVLARQGEEALMRTYPAQERDRSVFAALDGVNADGHVWDVAVRFPDGTIGRPVIVGWQDLASGKLLAWRMDQTESSDLVRLAFADMVTRYGIPRACWLDNGRAFASKFLTGGTPNRYRFKVRAEDPVGIITGLGVHVHWVTPYQGQAKPIERAWRDFCDSIAKHPAFAGAWMGNNVLAKPENYGSRAIEWATFAAVVDDEIAAHNARVGRRAKVCGGRSFDETFSASYAHASIRKATSDQLRMLLLAADAVTASAQDGSVRVAGNRYWCEALSGHAGRKVVLRFDPMALHTAVHCYALDGAYIGEAECIASVGFADTNASREHARAKQQYRRANKLVLDAERRMDAASVAAQLPRVESAPLPPAAVVAPLFGSARKTEPRIESAQAARTGTDDADTGLNDFLKRIQEQQNRERL